MKKNWQVKDMLYIVTLAAISIVLGLIEIPWPFIPPPLAGVPFLKLDFSEIAILVSLILIGADNTFLVIILRTVSRRLIMGMDPAEWVGELLAVTASLVLVSGYKILMKIIKKDEKPILYNKEEIDLSVSLKEVILGMTISTILLMTVLLLVNFAVTTPLYLSLYKMDETSTVMGIINGDSVLFAGIKEYIIFSLLSFLPFNLVKGLLISGIFFGIKPHLKALIF